MFTRSGKGINVDNKNSSKNQVKYPLNSGNMHSN